MKDEKRIHNHKKNLYLEEKLHKINSVLKYANQKYIEDLTHPNKPIVLIVGAPRSGTTLLYQQLAKSNAYTYPTNFMSRFPEAPSIAFEIQEILTKKELQVKDEFYDVQNLGIQLKSEIGKTKGILGPNEFWYFWRRFFDLDADYSLREPIISADQSELLMKELSALQNLESKPLLFKGLIFNQHIDSIYKLSSKFKFVWIKRDLQQNMDSLLRTRISYFGTTSEWYSFKLKEYEILKNLNPRDQVENQINIINNSISTSFSSLPENNKIEISLHNLVQSPKELIEKINRKLL